MVPIATVVTANPIRSVVGGASVGDTSAGDGRVVVGADSAPLINVLLEDHVLESRLFRRRCFRLLCIFTFVLSLPFCWRNWLNLGGKVCTRRNPWLRYLFRRRLTLFWMVLLIRRKYFLLRAGCRFRGCQRFYFPLFRGRPRLEFDVEPWNWLLCRHSRITACDWSRIRRAGRIWRRWTLTAWLDLTLSWSFATFWPQSSVFFLQVFNLCG